ncbi:MAG: hypothetical protein HC822_16855 [Oscillochloris sp.]|nr:hypothetical protein [Oscillochloris sp.]
MPTRRTLWMSLFVVLITAGALLAFVVTPLAAATPTISLLTPAEPQPADALVDVPIQISQVENLGAWEFDLSYDPALVEVVGMTIEPFFGAEFDCTAATQRCVISLGPLREATGNASVGAISYGTVPGASGEGVIAILHLRPTGRSGTTGIALSNALITDAAATAQTPAVQPASLTLEGEESLYLPLLSR